MKVLLKFGMKAFGRRGGGGGNRDFYLGAREARTAIVKRKENLIVRILSL